MHKHIRKLESTCDRVGTAGCLFGRLLDPAKHVRHDRAIRLARTPVILALVLCVLAGLGCSSEKREVEDVAFQWIEGIKNKDADTFERIIDWRLWYTVSSGGAVPKGKGGRTPASSDPDAPLTEEQEYQKSLLIALLTADKIVTAQYLTAEHDIKRVSIDGSEALVEISQTDRTTTDKRLVVLQMHKDPVEGWRIYKFRKEDLEEV